MAGPAGSVGLYSRSQGSTSGLRHTTEKRLSWMTGAVGLRCPEPPGPAGALAPVAPVVPAGAATGTGAGRAQSGVAGTGSAAAAPRRSTAMSGDATIRYFAAGSDA